LKAKIFSSHSKQTLCVAYYNADVVVVISEVIGLTPGFNLHMYIYLHTSIVEDEILSKIPESELSGGILLTVLGPRVLCCNQGDQIGRISASWEIVFFGQFF
jgi:hypothetical protein